MRREIVSLPGVQDPGSGVAGPTSSCPARDSCWPHPAVNITAAMAPTQARGQFDRDLT